MKHTDRGLLNRLNRFIRTNDTMLTNRRVTVRRGFDVAFVRMACSISVGVVANPHRSVSGRLSVLNLFFAQEAGAPAMPPKHSHSMRLSTVFYSKT